MPSEPHIPDDVLILFGRGLRMRRHQLGLTQAELAARLGLTRTQVSQWEGGSWRRPYLDMREVAARGVDLLGVDLVALLLAPQSTGRPKRRSTPKNDEEWSVAREQRAPEWAAALAERMARVERRLDALIAAVAAVTEPLRPQESAQEPDFLTVKEIAAAMRVSERTVLRWQDRGQMPCVRIGGRTLTTKADLVEFIERAQRGEFRTRRRSARNS